MWERKIQKCGYHEKRIVLTDEQGRDLEADFKIHNTLKSPAPPLGYLGHKGNT